VILLPLPTWIALALLPILFGLSLHHRKQNYNPSTAHLRVRPARSWLYTTTLTIYYLLIVANILMETLEIVRLELLHFGIGLQPFAYVGLIMGGLLHWSKGLMGRVRGWQAINAVLWVGGCVMTIVQTVGLVKEGIHGRKGSKYPVEDQVTDVAVMAGVYAVVAILEVVLSLWRVKRAQKGEGESVASESPNAQGEAWGMK
jgi:uncharacterized membrane protein